MEIIVQKIECCLSYSVAVLSEPVSNEPVSTEPVSNEPVSIEVLAVPVIDWNRSSLSPRITPHDNDEKTLMLPQKSASGARVRGE